MEDYKTEIPYTRTHQHPAWRALGNILEAAGKLLWGTAGTTINRPWTFLRKQINASQVLLRRLRRKVFGAPSQELLETAERAISEGLAESGLYNGHSKTDSRIGFSEQHPANTISHGAGES